MDTADLDHRTLASFQFRQQRLRQQERRKEINLQRREPIGTGEFISVAENLYCGIVNQDIDANATTISITNTSTRALTSTIISTSTVPPTATAATKHHPQLPDAGFGIGLISHVAGEIHLEMLRMLLKMLAAVRRQHRI